MDLIFPQTEMERRVRNASTEDFFEKISISFPDKKTLAVFSYRDPFIRTAIWMFKYRRNMWLAKIFAEAIDDSLIEEIGEKALFENFNEPILIPMPLSRKRRRFRGFNQSELIAKEVSNLSGFPYEKKVLIKVKETESQTHKNKKERRENIKGTFKVKKPEKIKRRNIILIDDVYTTGSTLGEADKVLREAGAKKVFRLVVAH